MQSPPRACTARSQRRQRGGEDPTRWHHGARSSRPICRGGPAAQSATPGRAWATRGASPCDSEPTGYRSCIRLRLPYPGDPSLVVERIDATSARSDIGLSSKSRTRRPLACGVMKTPELTERIEHRVAVLHQEIERLEAAKKALGQSSSRTAVAKRASEPLSVPRRDRRASAPARATPQRVRARPANRRNRKPASVRTLFRELDTGLRNRP